MRAWVAEFCDKSGKPPVIMNSLLTGGGLPGF
jgi:hypothetical protein